MKMALRRGAATAAISQHSADGNRFVPFATAGIYVLGTPPFYLSGGYEGERSKTNHHDGVRSAAADDLTADLM